MVCSTLWMFRSHARLSNNRFIIIEVFIELIDNRYACSIEESKSNNWLLFPWNRCHFNRNVLKRFKLNSIVQHPFILTKIKWNTFILIKIENERMFSSTNREFAVASAFPLCTIIKKWNQKAKRCVGHFDKHFDLINFAKSIDPTLKCTTSLHNLTQCV